MSFDPKEYSRQYYLKNREKVIKRVGEYKKAHRSRYNELHKEYKKRNKEKIAEYNRKNAQAIKRYRKKYYEDKKENLLKSSRDNYQNNKEVILARNRKYKEKNRDAIRKKQKEYKRQRLINDKSFYFVEVARRRMLNALNGVAEKSARTVELLGCTGDFAVAYLESKFLPGMNWKNRKEWHIDHIKPLSIFDLTNPEEQCKAFHYTNLQPLWAIDNRRKAAKYYG